MSNETKKILLVEDNPGDERLIIIDLKKDRNQNYDLVVTRTLSESLKKIKECDFDAVIIDLGLPDSHRTDIFQQIHEVCTDIPIIVLTVLNDKQKAVEAIRFGVQDYLDKSKLQPEVISRSISYSIERKRVEKRIRREKERAQHYLDFAGVILLVLDRDGIVEMINRHGCDILGYSQDEIIGKPWMTTLFPTCFQGKASNFHQKIIAEEKENYYLYENAVRTKDGEERIISWRNTNIHNENGEIIGTVSSGEDITERKQAEAAIRESEDRLRQITDMVEDTFWIIDWETHKMVFASPAYEKGWGRSLNDLYEDGTNWVDAIHPDDKERAWESFKKIKPNQVYDEEYRIILPDGTQRWIRDRRYPFLDENGQVYRVSGMAQDITEKKQLEREMDAIANVSLALRSASSCDEMIPIIFDQMTNILNADGAVFINTDPPTNGYITEKGYGIWSDISKTNIDVNGITAHVIESRETYVNHQAGSHPDSKYSSPKFTGRASTVACVPLIAHQDVIGALWIGRETSMNDDSLRLLNSISNIAANAIQRATLHEKTMRSLKRLQALHNIDKAINASLDINFTLNVLIDQVIDQLDVDSTSIFLFDEHAQILKYAAGRGFHSTAALENTTTNLGDSLAGQAVLERRTIKAYHLDEFKLPPNFGKFIRKERFTSYIGVPLIAKRRVVGVLEVYNRSPLRRERDWMDFLETLAGQAAIAIDNASIYQELQQSNEELNRGYDQTIEGWAFTLEMRDDETKGHSQRVTDMTISIAKKMGVRDEEIVDIRRGAILHDIGKIAIPDEILHKPGPLTDEEWDLMKQHPKLAVEWLSQISFLEQSLIIPYYHHEKWDGTGYPEGLKGEEIPLSARIFAVVDVWDALLSDRPYRKAWSVEEALTHIKNQSGKHFDPEVVKVFLSLID